MSRDPHDTEQRTSQRHAHFHAWRLRMQPRDPDEGHRPATPLELLFDLCFVVAIAQVAARLHHAVVEHHVGQAIPAFVMVFFAIYWGWVNFAWFASAYDTDDTPYRLKVLVQILGVLVLAAGVPRAFDHADFALVTIGYTIMRVSLVLQWLRVARSDPACRATALRYAGGLVVAQAGWIAALGLGPELAWLAFVVLVPTELAVPYLAERARATPWHPHHIAERYGLLTIIVLGESVLAATLAIQAAIDGGELTASHIGLVAGGLLTLFAMWWIYFDRPAHEYLSSNRQAFLWGYGHFVIFGSAAAVGAGLAVSVDALDARADDAVSQLAAGLSVAIPVALFLASVWLIHVRLLRGGRRWLVAYATTTCAVIAAAWTPYAALIIGLVMAALVGWIVFENNRAKPGTDAI